MVIKAIIPAGGLGTRFLPITKSIPKELLPLIDKPALHYIIEEGIAAGIKNFTLVVSPEKQTIQNYLSHDVGLDAKLKIKGKEHFCTKINKLANTADFNYVMQQGNHGLGHAVWSARHTTGKELVAVMLPDDIITASTPGIAQLAKIALQEKCNVVAVREVHLQDISNYGVVAIKKQFSPNLFQVKELIEKPSPENAPSNLAIIGRYVFSPTIFEILGQTRHGALGEIQLTDAISELLFSGEKVFAYKIQGDHYDIGTPLGWLKATVNMALKHPEYSSTMLDYLSSIDKEMIAIQGRAEALSAKAKHHL